MKLILLDAASELAGQVKQTVATAAAGGNIELLTSGTTGTPKRFSCRLLVDHDIKRGGSTTDKFILTYSPQRWAGVSVILHCLRIDCELVVPRSLAPAEILAACMHHCPTHISLTPSMLRSLALNDAEGQFSHISFRQVTFGGEAATQSILNLAKSWWPEARITHTYASTEHGDICAVSDGLEGIPACKFSAFAFAEGADQGELVINGIRTGDVWRLSGGRYYFEGRIEEIINVGGNKVSPLVVEEVALNCGARLARAYCVESPMLGFLVGMDYVGEVEPMVLRKAMSSKLPKYACPAMLERVSELRLSVAGKIKRT